MFKMNSCGCCGTKNKKTSDGASYCPKGCDCIHAPDIILLRNESFACGEKIGFNIFEHAGIEQKEGTEVKLKSFDPRMNAEIDSEGNVTATGPAEWTEDKMEIAYRICKIDGIESASGCITIPMRSLCVGDEPCEGTCNHCTGEWICTEGSEVDGGSGLAPTSTTASGDWFYHDIETSQVQEGIEEDLGIDSDLMDIVDIDGIISSTGSPLISFDPENAFDDQGNFIFTQLCGVGIVTVNYLACLEDGTKDEGAIIINVNNPPQDCHYCDEDGVETPYEDQITDIIYDDSIISDVEISDLGEITSFKVLCNEDLPKNTIVQYTLVSCNEPTDHTIELFVECPSNCIPCQDGGGVDPNCPTACPHEEEEEEICDVDDQIDHVPSVETTECGNDIDYDPDHGSDSCDNC